MGKYSPLSDFLGRQGREAVRLDFDEFEKIVGAPLPASALNHQAWWANDPGHSQARAWITAGWKTQNLSLTGRTVTFVRASKPSPASPATRPAPGSVDPWGALADTVTIHDHNALTTPSGEIWDAEAGA